MPHSRVSLLEVTAWACDVSSATKAELQKRLLAPSATDGPRASAFRGAQCPVGSGGGWCGVLGCFRHMLTLEIACALERWILVGTL